jgi:hypothetical protein
MLQIYTDKDKTKVLIYFCEKLMKLKLLFTLRLLQNPTIRKSASAFFFASRPAHLSFLTALRSSLFALRAPRPAPSASRPAPRFVQTTVSKPITRKELEKIKQKC